MARKEALLKTADFIEHTSLGNFIFYAALLTTPAATGLTLLDISYPDLDHTVTSESTDAMQPYLDLINESEPLKEKYTRINEAIDNQQQTITDNNHEEIAIMLTKGELTELISARQEQMDVSEQFNAIIKTLKDDALTDTVLTEKDFHKIASEYNDLTRRTNYGEVPAQMAGILEECQATTLDTTASQTDQAKAVSKCMEVDEITEITTIASGVVPALSFLSLAIAGIYNIGNNSGMAERTADYLRRRANNVKNKKNH